MQVNPLWTIKLHPLRPAGPTKQRFVDAVAKTNSDSSFAMVIMIGTLVLISFSLHAAIYVGVSLLVDRWAKATAARGRTGRETLPMHSA